MEKCKKKKGYVAPDVELHRFVVEAGFALSLRGDSDGLGKRQVNDPASNPDQIGQYQDGENWTSETWIAS